MAAVQALTPEAEGETISEPHGPRQFVTFTCGSRSLGVDVMSVREIRSWTPTTPLPSQSFGAEGVLDIRGKVVEVFDLATLIGVDNTDVEKQGKVVLVVSIGERDLGITVDAVSDIIFAPAEQMRSTPAGDNRTSGASVSALIKNDERLIAILNLDTLFPVYSYV